MRPASLRSRRLLPPKPRASPAKLALVSFAILAACAGPPSPTAPASGAVPPSEDALAAGPLHVPARGQYIFRHWTFGDEPFWTDTLRLNGVVEVAVSPATALAVGLKVDAERLPRGFLARADLTSPATTVELLRRDAVVGVEARITGDKHIKTLGITCALCHSTVDNSVTAGVGRRLDGWPNRDLNVGAIVALSPALPPAVKAVFNSWGPGKYDAEFNRDGINSPVVIPPAFGLHGVALAGAGYGAFSNDLLIGNFGDGRIGAYDPTSGSFIDFLRDTTSTPTTIEGLWGLGFGPNSAAPTLFFSSGPSGEAHGLLGTLRPK